MPRIIMQGENPEQTRLLEGVVGAMENMRRRQMESDRMQLARDSFEAQKAQNETRLDQSQQRIDLARDQFGFNQERAGVADEQFAQRMGLQEQGLGLEQERAEREKQAFDRAISEEDAAKSYYMGVIAESGGDPAALEGAPLETIEGVANTVLYEQRLKENQARLDSIAEDIFESAGVMGQPGAEGQDGGEPQIPQKLAATVEGILSSADTLERQREAGDALNEILTRIEDQKEQAIMRQQEVEILSPLFEQAIQRAPWAAGQLRAIQIGHRTGRNEWEDALDALKMAKPSSGAQDPYERAFSSGLSAWASAQGRRFSEEPEYAARQAEDSYGALTNTLGGLLGRPGQTGGNAAASPAPSAPKIEPSERDMEMARGLKNRISNPDRLKTEFVQLAAHIVKREGMEPGQNRDLVIQIAQQLANSGG